MDTISYSQEDIEAMMIAAERRLKEDMLRTHVAKNGRSGPCAGSASNYTRSPYYNPKYSHNMQDGQEAETKSKEPLLL